MRSWLPQLVFFSCPIVYQAIALFRSETALRYQNHYFVTLSILGFVAIGYFRRTGDLPVYVGATMLSLGATCYYFFGEPKLVSEHRHHLVGAFWIAALVACTAKSLIALSCLFAASSFVVQEMLIDADGRALDVRSSLALTVPMQILAFFLILTT